MGRIIRLSFNVLYESIYFSGCFFGLISMFSLFYYFIGNDLGGHPDKNHGDGNDYERKSNLVAFFLYSYLLVNHFPYSYKNQFRTIFAQSHLLLILEYTI